MMYREIGLRGHFKLIFKYVMLESYRNEQELFNLQCWALTCESFFDTAEWIWIYNHFGYSGDYEFIYFE